MKEACKDRFLGTKNAHQTLVFGQWVEIALVLERLPEFSELEKTMLMGSSDFFGLTLACTHIEPHIVLFGNLTPITLTVFLFEASVPTCHCKEQLQWELCKSAKAAIPGSLSSTLWIDFV